MDNPPLRALLSHAPFVRFWLSRLFGILANQMLMVAVACLGPREPDIPRLERRWRLALNLKREGKFEGAATVAEPPSDATVVPS